MYECYLPGQYSKHRGKANLLWRNYGYKRFNRAHYNTRARAQRAALHFTRVYRQSCTHRKQHAGAF